MRILRTKGVAIGYHLEEDKSKRWWLTVKVTLLLDFPFELIDEESIPLQSSFCPAIGVKHLGAQVGIDVYVERHLRELMYGIYELLYAVEELKDPYILAHMPDADNVRAPCLSRHRSAAQTPPTPPRPSTLVCMGHPRRWPI